MIFGREPALIAAAVAIALQLAISFGLTLTPEQESLINALVIAVMAVVIRQAVYSPVTTQKIADRAAASGNTDIGEPPTGDPK